MSPTTNTIPWTPAVKLDLAAASKDAFEETIAQFNAHATQLKNDNKLPAFPFDRDGWWDITPKMAEAALMHSAGNRETSLATVKSYGLDMAAGDWPATGETIVVVNGKLRNGHHRLLAGYLSGAGFRCYVVVTAEDSPHIFAYYDCGKKRTAADALYIAGWNGSGRVMATAIANLAMRYDAGVLGVAKQPRFRAPNAREVLHYVQNHPDFRNAARYMLGTHPDAVEVIRSKPAAVFFAWLVLRAYDEAALGDFCTPFGSGARLEEDSPLLAARAKLLAADPPGQKIPDRERLAYVCKAFLMHVAGQKMPRSRGGKIQPLGLAVDEDFPRIEKPLAEAAQ